MAGRVDRCGAVNRPVCDKMLGSLLSYEVIKMAGNAAQDAKDIYRVRISKGFVDMEFGEGYLVEVWDYRVQRIVHGEQFKDLATARRREKEIKNDLDTMSMEKFEQAYLAKRRR
jgi:hypothetical protein